MLNFFAGMNQQHFDDWRLNGAPGRVVIYLPTEADCTYAGCGWDAFSQSGKLIGCPQCGGKGKTFAWSVSTVRARVVWGSTGLVYMSPTPGVVMGDCYLAFYLGDEWLVDEVLFEQRAYIEVDGRKVRPTSTSPSVIPNVGGCLLVTCNLYTDSAAD